ncbi:MAG TPA: C39 family peptidase [Burkholderiales bacterium]|nr:C39 family peptidase [Burkholderiales bacterium]
MRTGVVGLWLIVLAAHAITPARAEPGAVRSLLEMRHDNVIVQQWDISCGAAALATILRFQLGDPVTEKQVAQGMLRKTDPLRVKHRGGFSLLDMKRYAELRGFEADGYSGLTVANVGKLTPLIVPVRTDGYDHFVVLRGIAGGAAILADPAFGNRKVPLDEFARIWNGSIGFVVRARGEPAPANRLSPRSADFLAVDANVVRTALDTLPRPALALPPIPIR